MGSINWNFDRIGSSCYTFDAIMKYKLKHKFYNFQQLFGQHRRRTLWQCLMSCIKDQYAIRWTDRAQGRFRVTNPVKFFKRWNSQGGRVSAVENIWRSLRIYVVRGHLVKMHGKKAINEYQLPPRVMNAYTQLVEGR